MAPSGVQRFRIADPLAGAVENEIAAVTDERSRGRPTVIASPAQPPPATPAHFPAVNAKQSAHFHRKGKSPSVAPLGSSAMRSTVGRGFDDLLGSSAPPRLDQRNPDRFRRRHRRRHGSLDVSSRQPQPDARPSPRRLGAGTPRTSIPFPSRRTKCAAVERCRATTMPTRHNPAPRAQFPFADSGPSLSLSCARRRSACLPLPEFLCQPGCRPACGARSAAAALVHDYRSARKTRRDRHRAQSGVRSINTSSRRRAYCRAVIIE